MHVRRWVAHGSIGPRAVGDEALAMGPMLPRGVRPSEEARKRHVRNDRHRKPRHEAAPRRTLRHSNRQRKKLEELGTIFGVQRNQREQQRPPLKADLQIFFSSCYKCDCSHACRNCRRTCRTVECVTLSHPSGAPKGAQVLSRSFLCVRSTRAMSCVVPGDRGHCGPSLPSMVSSCLHAARKGGILLGMR